MTQPGQRQRPGGLGQIFCSRPVSAFTLAAVVALVLQWLPLPSSLHLWRPAPSPTLADSVQPIAEEQTEGTTEVLSETRTRTELALPEVVHLPAPASPIAQKRDRDFVVPSV